MGSHILQILSINQPMRTEVRCGKWPAGRQNICAFCHSVHTEWQDAHIWVFASQNEDAWSLQCLFLEQGCLIIAILSANSPKRWGRFCGKQRAKIRDATYLDHHPKSNTPHSHSTIQYISYDLSESRNLQVNCANFHAPPPNIKKKKNAHPPPHPTPNHTCPTLHPQRHPPRTQPPRHKTFTDAPTRDCNLPMHLHPYFFAKYYARCTIVLIDEPRTFYSQFQLEWHSTKLFQTLKAKARGFLCSRDQWKENYVSFRTSFEKCHFKWDCCFACEKYFPVCILLVCTNCASNIRVACEECSALKKALHTTSSPYNALDWLFSI